MDMPKIQFANKSYEAKRVRFCIDGGYENPAFEGFIIEGDYWNGWLQPYVTHEVYVQIIEEFIKPYIDCSDEDEHLVRERESLLEWFESDRFRYGYPHEDDIPTTINGLYAVGWGWCWDEQTEEPS